MKRRQFATEVGFHLEVIWQDQDLLEIRISAWNGTFRGVTTLYVGNGELEKDATILSGFPKHPSDVREITFGTFGREFAGGAASMKFYCTDKAGHAYVESRIESEFESAGVVQHVVISMPIEAAAVDSFVDELRRMERDRSGSAHLRGMG